MPWCDECSKFWSQGSVPPSGACPVCGRPLHTGKVATERRTRPSAAPDGAPAGSGDADDYRAPWHFKLMVALAVVYLGWRLVQLLTWLL